MAKSKVHMLQMVSTVLIGSGMEPGSLCRIKARSLLPLQLTESWASVSCERCLGKRPQAVDTPRTGWSRLVAWWTRGPS